MEQIRLRRRSEKPWMSEEQMRIYLRGAANRRVGVLYLAELNGISAYEVCRLLGIDIEQVIELTPYLESHGWTCEKMRQVIELYYEGGYTMKKISKKIGMSFCAVQRMLSGTSGGRFAPIAGSKGKTAR